MSRALISKRFTQSIFCVAHSNRLNESFTVFFIENASVFGSKVMTKRSSDKKVLKCALTEFQPDSVFFQAGNLRQEYRNRH